MRQNKTVSIFGVPIAICTFIEGINLIEDIIQKKRLSLWFWQMPIHLTLPMKKATIKMY